MRSAILLSLTILAVSPGAQPLPEALEAEAASALGEQLVDDLAVSARLREVGVNRIGVYRFEGDRRDRVSDQVCVALADSPWRVIEREEIERLTREQNLQEDLQDLLASDTLIGEGEWLGVEAILFGEVRSWERRDGALFADAVCWLVDLRTGERLWTGSASDTFDGTFIPATIRANAQPIALVATGLLLLGGLGVLFSPRRRRHRGERHERRREEALEREMARDRLQQDRLNHQAELARERRLSLEEDRDLEGDCDRQSLRRRAAFIGTRDEMHRDTLASDEERRTLQVRASLERRALESEQRQRRRQEQVETLRRMRELRREDDRHRVEHTERLAPLGTEALVAGMGERDGERVIRFARRRGESAV